MTPDGLMIGAQGPTLQVSLLGKRMIWSAEGSQLSGREDHRRGLGLSRTIRTTGQDTASCLVFPIPPFLRFLLLSQHRVGKHVATLSWKETHKPITNTFNCS